MSRRAIIKIGDLAFSRPPFLDCGISGLRKALERKIILQSQMLARNRASVRLFDDSALSEEIGSRVHNLIYWFETRGYRFWISTELFFTTSIQELLFRGISVSFFSGIVRAERKLYLFRAEWDDAGTTRDAQPHWHAYPMVQPLQDNESSLVDSTTKMFDDEATANTFEPNVFHRERASGIHLAMCANWCQETDEQDPHCIMLSPEGLSTWLGKCIAYMKEQLEYHASSLPDSKE